MGPRKIPANRKAASSLVLLALTLERFPAANRRSAAFLLDNGCRVEFHATHTKQRPSVHSARQFREGFWLSR
jgi:hypothetical protein